MRRWVLLVLLLALIVPGVAVSIRLRPATPGWSAPVVLGSQFQGCVPAKCLSFAQLAVNSRGDTLVAWRRYRASSSPGATNGFECQFALRRVGGRFGGPQALPGSEPCPSVALYPSGDVVAAWTALQGGRTAVLAQVRSASGVWQQGARVSALNESADQPKVAVAGSRGAIVVWASSGASQRLEAAAQQSGRRFGAPQTLASGGIGQPEFNVATDARGDAIVGWSTSEPGYAAAAVKIRSADGRWQPTRLLASTAAGAPSTPQVALDPNGNAIAVWSVYVPGKDTLAWSAFAPAGRPFGPAQRVAGLGSVSFDASGEALLTWTRSAGTSFVAAASLRSAGGTWQAPQTVSAPGVSIGKVVSAVSPAGDSVIVWAGRASDSSGRQTIQAASRPAGGRFGAPQDISPPMLLGSTLAVAEDASGRAVAVWDDLSGSVSVATYSP